MNATSSVSEMSKYVMKRDGVFRVREDGTYEPIQRPRPVKADVILGPEEIEVRRGYWGARHAYFSGSAA